MMQSTDKLGWEYCAVRAEKTEPHRAASSTRSHINLCAIWFIPLSWDYLSWTQHIWAETTWACLPLRNTTALSMSHIYIYIYICVCVCVCVCACACMRACVCVCVCVGKKNMLKHGWGSFVFWWMQICTVTRIKMRGDSTHSHNQVFHRKWLGVLEFCVAVSLFLQFLRLVSDILKEHHYYHHHHHYLHNHHCIFTESRRSVLFSGRLN